MVPKSMNLTFMQFWGVEKSQNALFESPAQGEWVAVGTHLYLYYFQQMETHESSWLAIPFPGAHRPGGFPLHSFLMWPYKETKKTSGCSTSRGLSTRLSGESVSISHAAGTTSRPSPASSHIALTETLIRSHSYRPHFTDGRTEKAQKGEGTCLSLDHRWERSQPQVQSFKDAPVGFKPVLPCDSSISQEASSDFFHSREGLCLKESEFCISRMMSVCG